MCKLRGAPPNGGPVAPCGGARAARGVWSQVLLQHHVASDMCLGGSHQEYCVRYGAEIG